MDEADDLNWDESDELICTIIEAELEHLRGEGPPVDLTGLDTKTRSEAVGIIEVIHALRRLNAQPASPSFDRDPVAVRLGLTEDQINDRPIRD